MAELAGIIIALPLGSAVLLHFFGQRLKEPLAGVIATGSLGTAFVLALVASLDFISGTGEAESVHLFDWIPTLGANAQVLWDPLSAVMTLTIT